MNAEGKKRVPLLNTEGETFKIYPWLSRSIIIVSLFLSCLTVQSLERWMRLGI